MYEHLSEIEIDGYVRGTLPPDEMLQMDDHITSCDDCRAEVAQRSPVDASVLIATLGEPQLDPHLNFDQTAAYVDGTLDAVGLEIADLHLHECRQCTAAVRDLEALKHEINREAGKSVSATASTAGFWDRLRQIRFPLYALATAAVLILGIVFAGWYLRDRKTEPETVAVSQPAEVPSVDVPAIEPQDIPEVSENSSGSEKPKPVITLNDGGRRIELDADGKVTGLGDPRSEQAVAGVLSGRELTIDPAVRQLRQASGQLMGEPQTGVPFALRGPVGTVVESARPTLSWKSLPGAETYQVDIFDESFNKVASSPPLKTSEWKPTAPLRRGGIFRWQVTALVNGEEVRSPVRPAPDARFKVLDAAAADRIADARSRNGGSHLLLGVLYAESGLLAEAERQFQALVRQNPGSPVARRLLEKVRAAR